MNASTPQVVVERSPRRLASTRAADLSLDEYLGDCRGLVLAELRRVMSVQGSRASQLYQLVLDYPLREAKGLRPALCIAVCRALGGLLEGVLPSAAVLELYHNAFLIHDDVEDGSERRRGLPTLHREHGAPIAINVGDAMLALALSPLLDNTAVVGLGKALRIMQVVARMSRESAEGQAIELAWIRNASFDHADAEYLRMVHKKTTHYSFIAPVAIGAIVAGADARRAAALHRFASALGSAFQIRDDILNLEGSTTRYGKEHAGDLWEGKHTLILLHALRCASAEERERAQEILRKSRPRSDGASRTLACLRENIGRLSARGSMSSEIESELLANLPAEPAHSERSQADVAFLFDLILRRNSLDYAREVARRRALHAKRCLATATSRLEPSVHREFLESLSQLVIERDH